MEEALQAPPCDASSSRPVPRERLRRTSSAGSARAPEAFCSCGPEPAQRCTCSSRRAVHLRPRAVCPRAVHVRQPPSNHLRATAGASFCGLRLPQSCGLALPTCASTAAAGEAFRGRRRAVPVRLPKMHRSRSFRTPGSSGALDWVRGSRQNRTRGTRCTPRARGAPSAGAGVRLPRGGGKRTPGRSARKAALFLRSAVLLPAPGPVSTPRVC